MVTGALIYNAALSMRLAAWPITWPRTVGAPARPGYYEVTPPTDATALGKLLAPDIVPTFTAEEMQALGAVLPPEAREHAGKLALVQLLNGGDAPTVVLGTPKLLCGNPLQPVELLRLGRDSTGPDSICAIAHGGINPRNN